MYIDLFANKVNGKWIIRVSSAAFQRERERERERDQGTVMGKGMGVSE